MLISSSKPIVTGETTNVGKYFCIGGYGMRRLLLGIVCLVGILVGCTDQSNTDQTKDINELKEQIEQLSLEKDALLNTVEEERKALELAMNQQVNNDYSMILAKDIEKYPQTLYKKTI